MLSHFNDARHIPFPVSRLRLGTSFNTQADQGVRRKRSSQLNKQRQVYQKADREEQKEEHA